MWVHQAAHILTNADQLSSTEVQRQYEKLLETMRSSGSLTAPLQQMAATFLKVTAIEIGFHGARSMFPRNVCAAALDRMFRAQGQKPISRWAE